MKAKLLAYGGLLGAVAASTCCLFPLVLVWLGASGAWIAKLESLADFQPFFLVFAGLSLGSSFWLVYRNKNQTCEDCPGPDSYSGQIIKNIVGVKVIIWSGAMLVTLVAAIDFRSFFF